MDLHTFLNYTLLGYPIKPIVTSSVIFIATFLFKNMLTTLLLKPLRAISKHSDGDTWGRVADLCEAPLRLLIFFSGIYIALHTLPFPRIEAFVKLVYRSALTFIIFWVLLLIVERFSNIFQLFSSKLGRDMNEDIQNFTTKSLRILVIILGVMAILQEWGVNVSAFVASLGLGGLAFALAAKDTVANLFGSVVIFSDRPFQVGDWVQTPDIEGTIEEIGIRSTKVRTFAQALVSVPNATFANAIITNWTRMGKRRIRMSIGLTYSTSIEQMQAIISDLETMLKTHPEVHPEVVIVRFDAFESSAMTILLHFFTLPTDMAPHLHVKESINFDIMRIVAKNGASFAFPSQSLYVESLPK